jgi:hypothetical protein
LVGDRHRDVSGLIFMPEDGDLGARLGVR